MLFARPNLHVLVIGLDHAGKTTILEKIKKIFCNQEGISPEKIPPTIGMNCKNKTQMPRVPNVNPTFRRLIFNIRTPQWPK